MKPLKSSLIETKLGPMLAISDEHALYLLEFIDEQHLATSKIAKFELKTKLSITAGTTEAIQSIEEELQSYFDGTLRTFKTPLHLMGSPFQKLAWQALMRIPYGQTRSYAAQATAINKPLACRAIGNANAMNQMAIVIPCHRVINSNGDLGGYAAGPLRKRWLLDHEMT